MLKKYLYFFRATLLAVLCISNTQLFAENFPLPESLKPNVEFWKRVYSEIDGQHGFIHDDRNLERVYEIIAIPENSSRRQRKQIVQAAKKRIAKQLKKLSRKALSQLNSEEQKIRRLFPQNVQPKEIRAASRHIRFQLGQADKFESAIRRSGYYNSYIKSQLSAAGLPAELAALPFVESSFNVSANSHVGAAGIWQFMPSTGRRFMKVNHVIDERYDPYRATDAAVRLLQYNYGILNSWPLALTAYNHGVGGMRRAVRQTGTTDIGVIVKKYRSRTFGFASRNFYAEFLAALEVSRHASRYFPGVAPGDSQNLARFTLPSYVPAKALASTLGVKMDKLRQHNLALREAVWNGDKRVPANYELRIPKHLMSGHIDQQLRKIPLSARFEKQVPDKTYRVRRGDSLSRIASLYGMRVNDLVRMNSLRSRHRIRVGQLLYLPQKGKPVPAIAAAAKKPAPITVAAAKQTSPKVADSKPKAAPVIVALAEQPEKVTDVVQPIIELTPQAKPTPSVSVTETTEVEETTDVVEQPEPLIEDEVVDSVDQIAATDPAEYSVADDNTIEIQAAETLGHYADWLSIRAKRLRQINKLSFRKALVIGERLKLDFSRVNLQAFEGKRLAYHKQLEDSFFATYRIEGTTDYKIRRGDSLWVIAGQEKLTPLWLIRQYNPDADFSNLKPGDKIKLPVIARKN